MANPAGFLSGALHAWSDVFPLGQLQNQAYGYLFPQGLFFLLAEPLPNWVAQRLWWSVVLGVGFSGFLLLTTRLGVGSLTFRVMAAALYALSPRAISTLGAISSETWPVMLAPWVLLPFVGTRVRAPVACSVLAVAAMGAVNATATAAACVPTATYLLTTLRKHPAHTLPTWLVGCAAVSAWWLGPLLVLGRFAPPFTDFIENSWVTTRWLNPTEILRGTTSWTPFVDNERAAGFALATEATFVLCTAAVAALGMAGLTLLRTAKTPWVVMLCVGLVVLGAAHGPLGEQVRSFLDGPGAALRNIHKCDPLVRIPLLVGFAAWGAVVRLPQSWGEAARPGRRQAVAVLVSVLVVCATSPAWSGQLSPRGGYQQVPAYWQDAADWLNAHAGQTRTLIVPPAQFARQTWGWTRDEPAQPLLEVPWMVRDAVPLVGPEAIRGLDGLSAVLASESVPPRQAFEAARRMGVGVVVVRHDLSSGPARALSNRARDAGFAVHTFGEVDVVEVDVRADRQVSSAPPVRVAGGGEVLALVDAVFDDPGAAYQLVDGDAEIVTDTPQLVARNYGAVSAAASAPLADISEGSDVHNPVADYPSAGPLTQVEQHGGQVRVSSSAADATSFGGVRTRRSVNAAVDGDLTTAWFPTAGVQEGEWIELRADNPADEVELRTTGGAVAVTFESDTARWSEWLQPHRTTRLAIPGGPTHRLRMTLGDSRHPVGVTEIGLVGAPITREITVANTSPHVQKFLFQQLSSPTGLLARSFTAPRDMDVRIDAHPCRTSPPSPMRFVIDDAEFSCGDTLRLSAGQHQLRTHAQWVLLTDLESEPGGGQVEQSGRRALQTRRAYNPGLEGYLGDTSLEPVSIDAGMQGFWVPPEATGEFHMIFAGERPYRLSLGIGFGLWALICLACLVVIRRNPVSERLSHAMRPPGLVAFVISAAGAALVCWLVGSWAGAACGLGGYAIGLALGKTGALKNILTPAVVGGLLALAGLWLAHAPWPDAQYAGDHGFVGWACLGALGCVIASASSNVLRST